jgi:anion-transporting  ArsA/GET3 family ATPase
MKTVLFYSFKGGVGRTQTMYNMAKYIAEEQNKNALELDDEKLLIEKMIEESDLELLNGYE